MGLIRRLIRWRQVIAERDECMRRTREPTRPAVDMRTRKEGSQ